MYNFFLKVGPGDVIEDISYFTTGCGFGTATCACSSNWRRVKRSTKRRRSPHADIEAQLDGYPEKKKDYPERALEALHVALDDYRERVSAGKVPDYAAMPRAAAAPPAFVESPAPPSNGAPDGKLTISLR